MKLFSNHKQIILLFLIFVFALSLRLYGLNWDQNQHLHPDERFLTMVATDIHLPSSLTQYFNNTASPLNPYNYPQYQFFVYGTFPLFLTKTVAVILRQDNYDQITLIGRCLSAIFDSFNVFLLYFLVKKVIKNKFVILPSLIYTLCVLPIQLSHFFAVDTYLNTFILATFTLLSYGNFPLAAVTFAFALASKISAVYFVPIIFLFLLRKYLSKKHLSSAVFLTIICPLITFVVFRILQPYSFSGLFRPNPLFISNLKTLELEGSPGGYFPPSVQWLSKIPLLFSLQNIAFWGLGLPLFIIFLISIFRIKFLKSPVIVGYSLIWILLIYFYQGSQFAHTMRYFLIIYPFVCLLAGFYLSKINRKFISAIVILQLLISLGFLSIYSRPHSRVQASDWIYQNISAGSIITNEYWDDALPLNLPEGSPNIYSEITLHPYDPDSPGKIQTLMSQTNAADYIIMSSNRLWASIPKVPGLYPLTAKFYRDLFNNQLNFTLAKTIYSYPGFNLPLMKNCYLFGPTNYPGTNNNWFTIDKNCRYPGIYLRDDTAEEAFTVYDHPQVLIFQKNH